GGGQGGAVQRVGSGGGQRHQQQRRRETPTPQQIREWFAQHGASGVSVRCSYVIRTGDRAGQTCGMFHTQHRCFSRLDVAWRAEFGDEAKRPRWLELLMSGVDIFALDYDAILAAMYALTVSPEGVSALHTFTLDSGASRCFFRDSTTLTPLPAPVPVRLADPSGGPVLARSSTVLLCRTVLFGSLSSLHLSSFSTNLLSASSPIATPCSCRLLSHQNLLGHHRLGHPSLPRLRGMHSRLLVSGLPRSPPPLWLSPAPPCLPCVKGRQRAAPHSSSFTPTSAPLQTLNMDIWGLARVNRLQLLERFHEDLPVLRLHSDRGGELSSDLLREFCYGEGIFQSFMLSASPQQNGVAERRIGLVMEVARTSMIHAAAPRFLWPFVVQYAAHQLNLWPRVSLPGTSPTLRWTGKVGDASVFRVWGSHALVRDTSSDKLSSRAIPFVFLGFPLDVPGWKFYHLTSCRVLPSQDVTFDESVPLYRLFPYHTASLHPQPLFLTPGPPPVDPLPPQGPTPSGVSLVDPPPLGEPVQVAVDSGAARGAASEGAEPASAEPGGAEPASVEPGGAEPEGAEPWGAESEGAESGGAEPKGAEPGGTEPEGAEHGGAESEGAESGGAEPRGTEFAGGPAGNSP
ncbi:unnamed protein product, partial [Closterium sp. NIES-54]